MFVRPLACALLLAAGATAQDSAPGSSAEGIMTIQTSIPSGIATGESTADGFMTIQTSVPSDMATPTPAPTGIATGTATDGESTSACLEVCVVEPCTQCPLTNPIRTSEIPQLSFCKGVYTNTPCISETGIMSIPQGETPLPSSAATSSTPAEGGPSSQPSRTSSVSRPIPTSSASGSVPEPTTTPDTPGAASSLFKRDEILAWGVAGTFGLAAWALL